MKILLINVPIRTWALPNIPPMGLLYITSVLKKEHEVATLDINAHRFSEKQVECFIAGSDADVFGIGGMITTFGYVKWLIGTIKMYHPDTKVIVGGGVSVVAAELHKTGADVVVQGEGERAILEALRTWFPVIRMKPIDPLELPFPSWDYWPLEKYLANPVGFLNRDKWNTGKGDGRLSMTISASRGCPYHCTYCAKDFIGMKYRCRRPENVFEEMRQLFDNYAVEYIHFIDDEFMADKEFVYSLSEMLIRSGLGGVVSWGCTGRVNLCNPTLYRMMKQAGCISIAFGIESGSQTMLNKMRKGVTVEQAINALKVTKDIFGENDFSLIIGLPGETEETLKETNDFLYLTNEKPEVVFFATPYPGTALYQQIKHKIPDEITYIESLGEQGKQIVFNCSDLPDETLIKWQQILQGG